MTVLTVTSLGTPGDGIARLPSGQVVFIPDTLPGDTVEIEIDQTRSKKKKKKLLFGRVKRMIEPSLDRVSSRCKVDACGGCVLREWSQEGQAGFKVSRVREALKRIGKLEHVPEATLIQSGDGWNYRHRARLHCFFQVVRGDSVTEDVALTGLHPLVAAQFFGRSSTASWLNWLRRFCFFLPKPG